MKLLFDQNLSIHLVQHLADVYPGASHVSLVGLDRASDTKVWTYAKHNDFTIVTKDADFNDLTVAYGFPPKVIWLRIGNCTTQRIESILRANQATVAAFIADPNAGILSLF